MNIISAVLAAVACLTLAACDNRYIERKDTLTLGAGDAVAANAAVMTHNPWPKRSQDDRIPMDGVKAEAALVRYRAGGPGPNGGGYGGPPPAPPPGNSR